MNAIHTRALGIIRFLNTRFQTDVQTFQHHKHEFLKGSAGYKDQPGSFHDRHLKHRKRLQADGKGTLKLFRTGMGR